jgi:cobalt-zinc-cadmium efflux system outer membrane protein
MTFPGGDARTGWALFTIVALISAGCQPPPPSSDVIGQADRLSGIDNAIQFADSKHTNAPMTQPANSLGAAQAVRLALEHDPRIAAALWRVRAAESDTRQARLLPNPIITIDVRFPETGGMQATEITPTEDLIAILQMPQQIGIADNRLRESTADALTVVLDTIEEVQTAYASAQSIDAQIVEAEKRVGVIRQLSDLSHKRFDAGEGTQLDVLTLEAQRVQAETDLDDLRLTRLEQRLKLARLIGRPRSAADWTLEEWQPSPVARADESAWLDAALENRPEIKSKIWELAALGEVVKLGNLSPLAGDSLGPHAEHDPKWRVGPVLTIPVPIFDQGQEVRAKAEALRQAALDDLNQESLSVIEEVRLAYATYAASLDTARLAREQLLPLQDRQLTLAETAYKSGDADLTTLLLAETDQYDSRTKVLALQVKAAVALVQLQRAAGGAGVASRIESAATTQLATQPATQPGQTGQSP